MISAKAQSFKNTVLSIMAALDNYFVEVKEEYVSKERGNRVVHDFLKENSGESVLAVVGAERSLRHMFYVVSEEFLNVHGPENLVNAGFRWRSRREVVKTAQEWGFDNEKENRCVASLEDMYEDKKCQKKVRVRWFHPNKEIMGVVSLWNPHPKEVFIAPYFQVISAECVEGPATVLTCEHYEKCLAVFPRDLLGNMNFCDRQLKSNREKPFRLSKLSGYFDQPILLFYPDYFEEECSTENDLKVGAKRNRSHRDYQKLVNDLPFPQLKCDLLRRELSLLENIEAHFLNPTTFKLNEKVEFLCQDSGIRGCWFSCSVLEVSKRGMKILYQG